MQTDDNCTGTVTWKHIIVYELFFLLESTIDYKWFSLVTKNKPELRIKWSNKFWHAI